jgi:serine/threonine protein kinase
MPGSLAATLAERGPLAPAEGLALFLPLLGRVSTLHATGRLHGAIAPDRVRLEENGLPVLEDPFPIALLQSSDPESCPPELAGHGPLEVPTHLEQARTVLAAHGLSIDPRRIDVYQLAVLLIRLSTGRGVNEFRRSPLVAARMPAPWRCILDRALGFNPQDQFHSVEQFQAALEPGNSGTATTPDLNPHPPSPLDAQPPPGGAVLPFARLSHYRVDGLLGRGGMGEVYRGWDDQLNRPVALKVLRPSLSHNPALIQRFHKEAGAAGKLAHPHLVAVYWSGEDHGVHFFAMQYVEGESLETRLAQGRLPLKEALAILEQCLLGLEVIHLEKLIHRDIKPANVLLEKRTGHALLADFGLVKDLTEVQELTSSGVVMGTLGYMAPEQARGERVDQRADLYSLGVVAYRMLSGQLPLVADSPAAMLYQHRRGQPQPLRQAISDLPEGVFRLVEKMTAKQADARYASCSEALSDLRCLRGAQPEKGTPAITLVPVQPTIPPTLLEAPIRRPGIRRNVSVMALTVALVASLVLGAVGVALFASQATREVQRAKNAEMQAEQEKQRADQEAQRANQEKQRADQEEQRGDLQRYARHIALAQSAMEHGDVASAKAQLTACRRDLRGWEHRYLHTLLTRKQQTLKGHTDAVWSVAISADGQRVVSGSDDGTVKVWDSSTCHDLLTLKGHTGRVLSVAISPDGKWIVSGSQDRTVRVWDSSTGRNHLTLEGHTDAVWSVAISPDGKQIISGSLDSTLKLWDSSTAQNLGTLYGHRGSVRSVAISPDGKQIVSGSSDQTVKLWDSSTRQELLSLKGHTGGVSSVAISSDGKRIVSGSEDGTVKVWDSSTHQELLSFKGHTGWISSVVFSPDSERIVSGSEDGTVMVWRSNTDLDLISLRGHTGWVNSVAFSPDGKRLASAGRDGTVKIWEATANDAP